MTHNFDATDQSMGRLATQIALVLRGKMNPAYKPNVMPNEKVIVSNIKNLKFTGDKLDQKMYYRYSGYPGGIYARTLRTRFEKDPKELFRSVVYAMLAKNRLRDKIIKHLEIQ